MPTVTERIATLKNNNPAYQRYNFNAFIGGKADVSYIVICPENHQYTTSIGRLEEGRMCKDCDKDKKKILSQNQYDLLMSKIDENGEKLDFTAHNGETWILAPNDKRVPGRTTKIHIRCNVHGVIQVTIGEMLKPRTSIIACKLCNKKGAALRTKTTEQFIKEAQEIHKDENGNPIYEYTRSIYTKALNYITITCRTHGDFSTTTASSHINTANPGGPTGCSQCAVERGTKKLRLGRDKFIAKCQLKHIGPDGLPAFDYSKTYINEETGEDSYTTVESMIKIICPTHGEFMQNAYKHKKGQVGCKNCKKKFKGEVAVGNYLESRGITFTEQKTFDWLVYVRKLKLDFYIESINTAIEFNGIQHEKPVTVFGGEEGLKKYRERDAEKYRLCGKYGVNLLVIKHNENIEDKINEFIIPLHEKYLKETIPVN